MRRKVELPLSGAACNNKATPSAASEQGKSCRPLLRSGQGFDACSSFSHKSFAPQNLCGSPKIIPQNSLTRLLREPYDSLRRVAELNNPFVLPLASHRLGGARETPPRSGNAPSNGAFPSSQVGKAPPRRGKAVWSAARFVCRMTLYACGDSFRLLRRHLPLRGRQGNSCFLNYFREQNHAFALRDPICPMLRAYCP